VVDRRQNPENAAEAVEERHRQAEPVILGEVLVLADIKTVVPDIVMGEHDPFGKSCGAGSVLHVDQIMAGKFLLTGDEGLVGGHGAQCLDFRYGIHAPVLFLSQKADPFKMGEVFAVKAPSLLGLQFRNQVIDRVDIIGILESVNQEEVLGFRLVEQVFEFRTLVVGVYGQ